LQQVLVGQNLLVRFRHGGGALVGCLRGGALQVRHGRFELVETAEQTANVRAVADDL